MIADALLAPFACLSANGATASKALQLGEKVTKYGGAVT
jgi:hypothetical protein